MTRQKHLKDRIRARMKKTGESYTVARRQILAKIKPPSSKGPERFHYPGNVPATTALRVLLAASGLLPKSGADELSEAMLFGIAGGVGAGVFAFRYEKEDFSSFFVAGRHLWQDDLAYLQNGCRRLGVDVDVKETGGAKTAEQQLRAMLEENGPVIAWVDMTGLPRHSTSPHGDFGQYHVVTIYGIDDAKKEAIVGDLADEPDRVPLDVLSKARARIKKQKNRLLRISNSPGRFDLNQAVKSGMQACHDTLLGKGAVKTPGGKGMAKNFTLDAFHSWAERLHGRSDKQSWTTMFPRGINLWRGLTSIYSFIHYGTGGGLSRPLYAEFFCEADEAIGGESFQELSDQYRKLGQAWDELGEAALPDEVESFRAFRTLSAERAELTLSGGEKTADRIRENHASLNELEKASREDFPLSEKACDELLADLHRRVLALHRGEVAAHQRLGEVLAQLS